MSEVKTMHLHCIQPCTQHMSETSGYQAIFSYQLFLHLNVYVQLHIAILIHDKRLHENSCYCQTVHTETTQQLPIKGYSLYIHVDKNLSPQAVQLGYIIMIGSNMYILRQSLIIIYFYLFCIHVHAEGQ